MVKYLSPLAFFDINMKLCPSIEIFHKIFSKCLSKLILIELHSENCLILKMYPLIMDKLSCF